MASRDRALGSNLKVKPKINDTEISKVVTKENNESLVALLGLKNTYLPSQITPDIGVTDSTNLVVRKTVKAMLERAILELPKGYGFVLIEGYRSYTQQKLLFDNEICKLKNRFPELSESEINSKATRFVSNPNIYSPHVTGGAIDLAIVNETQTMLDMGNMFEYDASAQFSCAKLTPQQRAHRSLLKTVMTAVGFVNYPYEWWHWSYGDKYWGFITDNTAFYDSVMFDNHSTSLKA